MLNAAGDRRLFASNQPSDLTLRGRFAGRHPLFRSTPFWAMLPRGESGGIMDQTVLFILFLLAMLLAWFGPRWTAVAVFGIALVLTFSDFFYHATGALTLSF
jgi:hypothetical protein